MNKNRLLQLLQLTMLALMLAFLLPRAANMTRSLQIGPPDHGWLLLACLLGMLAHVPPPLALRDLLLADQARPGLLRTWGLLYVPLLGKYIPGKVWTAVWAASAYARVGLSPVSAPLHFAILTVTSIASSALVAGLPVLLKLPPLQRLGIVAALGIVLALLYHDPRRWAGSALARLRGLLPPACLGYYFIYWILLGLGFACLVRSLAANTESSLALQLAGAYALANGVGFLAFFVPAGIGAREAALVAALAPALGTPLAVVLATASRVWQTILEIVCALVGGLSLLTPARPERPQI